MGDKHATKRKSLAKKKKKKKKKNITILNKDTTPQGHSKLMLWITATSQYCFVYNHCIRNPGGGGY